MKKADFMLNFVFWLIIGIVFFLPACGLGSKFLAAASSKEKNSYTNLLASIESMNAKTDGSAETHTLYLNSGTAVLVFPSGIDKVILKKKGGGGTLQIQFAKPSQCGAGLSCVCSCTEFDENAKFEGSGKYTGQCKKAICREFAYNLNGACEIKPGGSVKTESAFTFECTQGVYIGREVKFKSPAPTMELGSPRARVVKIEKTSGAVSVRES